MTKEDNPFDLYVEDVSPNDFQKAQQATDAFKNTWNELVRKWRQLQKMYEQQGANDTAAREAMAEWIKKQAMGPMWLETDEDHLQPINEHISAREQGYINQIQKLKKQLDFWIERAQEGGTIGGDGICGVSSNNLSLVASGVREEPHPREYPRDDSDWIRCKRTIQRMEDPEWLIKILQKFPSKEGWNNFKVDLIRTTAEQLEKAYL